MNNLVEISKSGIKLAQKGLSTTAQNITNAESLGYTRKRLIGVPEQFSSGSGFTGLGVKAADFDYLRDMRTESMIQSKHHQKSYLEQKAAVLSRLETSFVSDTGNDLDARMQKFLQSFGSLASSPSSQTKKAEVVREAQQLISSIHRIDEAISQQKSMVKEQTHESLGQVNRLLQEINSLNEPIQRANQRNQSAFDLMDQQLVKIKELSTYLDINVTRQESGQISVRVGGIELLGDMGVQTLGSYSNAEGTHLELRIQRSGQLISTQQGELGALLELNNEDLSRLQQDLDTFVSHFVDRVNHEHEQGISTRDTLQRSFFTLDGRPAQSIALNLDIQANPEFIAVTDPLISNRNGAIAQNIAQISEAKLMDAKGPIEFAIAFISRPGSEVARLNDELALRTSELELLETQQQQVSGVNVDEELSNMIQYQQAYQGAAKVLESAQMMYQTLFIDHEVGMRITQKMVFDGFLKNINQNRLEMSRLQEHIASGKKITKTSDSPLSFKQARLLEAKIRDKEFFTSQINEAKSTAQVAQQSLDEVADRLIEIKSIVTRGANQVQGSGGYKTMALEVEHLKAELIHSLNVTSSTGYVFAGTDHEQIPFSISDTEAGGVDYLGNSIQVEVEVEKGNFIQPSITGSALRDAQGIDLFETIDQTINALENEEVANLSSQLEQYDTLLAHVSDQAANVGFEWNKMEFLEERQEMITNTFKGELSTIVDTDFAETFSVLQRTEIAFQSAMTVHAQMMNQSLLEYL